MSTAVMTRRAFDTWGNVADGLCRCLETPYSDVLEHHTAGGAGQSMTVVWSTDPYVQEAGTGASQQFVLTGACVS